MTDYAYKLKKILSEKEAPPLCYLHSFGCQQNVNDGEKILGLLMEIGYGMTSDISSADLIIYNTCAVRENAELKIYGLIGNLKHLKEQKPDLIIGICGCMAQQEHVVEKIKKTYKQVDMIFGTYALNELPRLLYNVITESKTSIDITEYNYVIPESVKANENDIYIEATKKNIEMVEKFKATGVNEGDLVYFYLGNQLLNVVTTMNARNTQWVCRLRCCNKAQWQIRFIAKDIAKQVAEVATLIGK